VVDNQEQKSGVVVVSSRVVAQRLKDRTVAMMRTFGPNWGMSTTHRHREDVPVLALDAVIDVIIGIGRITMRRRTSLSSSSWSMSTSSMSSILFINSDMTRMMLSKDVALVRIMEDQEMVMENLASGIEEFKYAESRVRHVLMFGIFVSRIHCHRHRIR